MNANNKFRRGDSFCLGGLNTKRQRCPLAFHGSLCRVLSLQLECARRLDGLFCHQVDDGGFIYINWDGVQVDRVGWLKDHLALVVVQACLAC